MNDSMIRMLGFSIPLLLIIGCGGKKEEEFKFYTLKEAETQQLELTVEASGTVEAISSIEIKSKASGQILFLGAEIEASSILCCCHSLKDRDRLMQILLPYITH